MAALPTGTITFLFTDIEGSTSRWEHQREAMQRALARHDTILREAIESHGGHVFKTVGDAFYAVFSSAPDALEAALAAQRALEHEGWADVLGPVRVRMALHTGTAEARSGDYFGPALNRVARLLAAGHGGQILLSTVTQELVRDQLPAGMELRDMGEHRLKDLIRSERVFQVLVPDLPADFPPLKTLDNRPNNLPLQPNPFIGREHEVDAVRQRLLQPEVRFLTLTGAGGTGKTRLALQVAADLLDNFRDGVFFVNLAPISDPDLVPSTIAATLSIRATGHQSLLDALQAYLRTKHLLLVLDNFEQVLAAAATVPALLGAAAQLKLLVTSRAPLRVQGEHEFPVPPLALPDLRRLPSLEVLSQYEAVRLFIQRAQAVKPDFTVTNANAPAVAEICVRLDGLPLAIELAAARSKLLPPAALLQRLSNRLRLLTGGRRDLPARHQTLRGTIEWSYDLLDAVEQMLFSRLAVFAGGCTLEAAEAVCNAEGDLTVDILDGVASLVDKSLLEQVEGRADEPRLVMLETIHEYARERLEASGEAAALRRRHAAYFLQLAEIAEPQLEGSEEVAWLERLQAEHDNLRAALGWLLDSGDVIAGLRLAGALETFWELRGFYAEGRTWLGRLLAADEAQPPSVQQEPARLAARARSLRAAGRLAERQADLATLQLHLQESLSLYRLLGDKWEILSTLTLSSWLESDRTVTRAYIEERLALAKELGHKGHVSGSLIDLGHLAQGEGRSDEASVLFAESLALAREWGNKTQIAVVLLQLGCLARRQGDYKVMRTWITEALAIFRELGDTRRVGRCLAEFGLAARARGEPTHAVRLIAAGAACWDAIGAGRTANYWGEYDVAAAAIRDERGEEAFAAAQVEGQAMSLEQAMAYALEETATFA